MNSRDMQIPDWRLPRGVSRSIWEYAHDPRIVSEEAQHLAHSVLLEFDRRTVSRWFTQPGPLVDLGCGTGRLLLPFASRGYPALGVDLSADALQHVRCEASECNLSVALVQANLCELDCLPDQQFDYALLMFGTLGMVEGAANRRAVLQHACRLLRPGGLLALHVHNVWRHLYNPDGRRWLLRDRIARLSGKPHAGDTRRDYRGIPGIYHHAFSRGEFVDLITSSGFQIREIVPVPAEEEPDALPARMWFSSLRATGWIVLASRC